jgi:hypothetical protein
MMLDAAKLVGCFVGGILVTKVTEKAIHHFCDEEKVEARKRAEILNRKFKISKPWYKF